MDVRPGDFQGNLSRALQLLGQAHHNKADLLVLPEGIFPGYPSNDMLFVRDYIARSQRAADAFCAATANYSPTVIFGSVENNRHPTGRALQNYARVCQGGKEIHRQAKVLLPTYGPFDDARYFQPGTLAEMGSFMVNGVKVVPFICEDGWYYDTHNGRIIYVDNTIDRLKELNGDVYVSLSASPWNDGKVLTRIGVHSHVARVLNAPVLWSNQFGVVDHLIFDGTGFGLDAVGNLTFQMKSWQPDSSLVVVPMDKTKGPYLEGVNTQIPFQQTILDARLSAIEVGLREFARHIDHDAAVFGISGGADSALAAAYSVRALGAENVFLLKMPSEVSSVGSITDSDELIKNLGIPPENVLTLPIQTVVDAVLEVLGGEGILKQDLMDFDAGRVAIENIQARLRMVFEFVISNLSQKDSPMRARLAKVSPHWEKFLSRKAIKIATSDKSELALGNGTIFADIAGVYMINGDQYKTELWQMAEHINKIAGREIIPEAIIKKAPTPELLRDQLTTDKFPDYHLIDPILRDLIEFDHTPDELRRIYGHLDAQVSPKFLRPTLVDAVIELYERSEFKRELAQMPSARLSGRAFGKERRMTITVAKYWPFSDTDATHICQQALADAGLGGPPLTASLAP